jgi:hypothetical protein
VPGNPWECKSMRSELSDDNIHTTNRHFNPVIMRGVKGVNTGDSVNTHRFEKLGRRLQNANVDVLHQVHHAGLLDERIRGNL